VKGTIATVRDISEDGPRTEDAERLRAQTAGVSTLSYRSPTTLTKLYYSEDNAQG